jgi:hypothetical protein
MLDTFKPFIAGNSSYDKTNDTNSDINEYNKGPNTGSLIDNSNFPSPTYFLFPASATNGYWEGLKLSSHTKYKNKVMKEDTASAVQ